MFGKLPVLTLTPILLATTFSTTAFATAASHEIIVAPSCLLKNINGDFKTLAKSNDFVLVKTDAAGITQLSDAKAKQKQVCGGFINVTDDYATFNAKKSISTSKDAQFLNAFASHSALLTTKSKTYGIHHEIEVNRLLATINPENMWHDLTILSNYENRYANSENGVKAANWLKTQIETIAADNNRDDVTTYFVQTGTRYKQPSLVVKFGNGTGPGVVVGAHMDTLDSSFSKKPGADDDGSGTVTALETARTILSSGMHFNKPIYFIWYAAEEEGLVGSQYVVKDFKAKKIPVDAVMHMDMTGFAYENDPTMWLMTDFVNQDLTNYFETLIKTYVKQPVGRSSCGYACSDHATWTKNGYPAAIAFEASFDNMNPYIHTSSDTMSNLSLAHMADYAKLGVAFVTELAEPVAG